MRNLVIATFYSSAGTLSTLVFGAIVIKILAITNGAAGVGLFSILRQFQQTLIIIALLGGQTAIVQGLASFQDQARDNFLIASFKISLFTSLISCVLIVVFAPYLNQWIFSGHLPGSLSLIYWSVIPLLCGSVFTFLCSVLNGNRAVGSQAMMQLAGAFIGACVAYPLALNFQAGHNFSYIILLSIPFAVGSLLALIFTYRKGFLKPLLNYRNLWFRPAETKYFLSFASVTLFTTLLQAGVILSIRALILKMYGMSTVGQFDAAWTLSMMYIMLILNSIAMFYLPELSKTLDPVKRQGLIENVMRLAIVVLIPLITLVLAFKYYYILIFYSKDFLSSIPLIQWMILGDFFKVFGWIFAVSMLAYARMKPFFWSELLWHSSFLGLATLILRQHYAIETLGLVFFGLYFAYFIFCTTYICHSWKFQFKRQYFVVLSMGFCYLLIVLALSWNEYTVHWLRAGVLFIFSLALSLAFWLYTGNNKGRTTSLSPYRLSS